jgi:transposase
MQPIAIIGLDIAKSVFQVHGIDANGKVIVRRQLKRRYVLAFFEKLPSCTIGIEACASAPHWSRELQALGHAVRLMPPAYVKPYVKRHKNDAIDAEAICEAVTRPNMRFVATKTPGQQSCLTLHRTRHLFIRQQRCATLASRWGWWGRPSSKSVGAVFGLTPARNQSGERDYPGAISRCGDKMMRTTLYEAAQIMLMRLRLRIKMEGH